MKWQSSKTLHSSLPEPLGYARSWVFLETLGFLQNVYRLIYCYSASRIGSSGRFEILQSHRSGNHLGPSRQSFSGVRLVLATPHRMHHGRYRSAVTTVGRFCLLEWPQPSFQARLGLS